MQSEHGLVQLTASGSACGPYSPPIDTTKQEKFEVSPAVGHPVVDLLHKNIAYPDRVRFSGPSTTNSGSDELESSVRKYIRRKRLAASRRARKSWMKDYERRREERYREYKDEQERERAERRRNVFEILKTYEQSIDK